MQQSSEHISTFNIAFYNLENLFDTHNDSNTLDDDFTPNSIKRWNKKRFQKKVKKLGEVISNIGFNEIGYPPVIIGVAEVENRAVLEALVNSNYLIKKGYEIVHFDSPDERGIDTGLLYRKDFFTVEHKETFTLMLKNEFGVRDFTRDILYVKGSLEGEPLHVLVNHWPSRRAGAEETAYKRIAAAIKNKEIVDEIASKDPAAKILVMGDFNDDPHSESIKELTLSSLYNPMEVLLTNYSGSTNYRGAWNLFDQILLSHNFLQQYGNSFRFDAARIFNPKEITEFRGRSKGNPFRTFIGRKYLGGFSDHFPVYGTFSIHNKQNRI
jgi:predicted extracellular nuclease